MLKYAGKLKMRILTFCEERRHSQWRKKLFFYH